MQTLTTLNWILAFAGAAIHVLLKIAEKQKEPDYVFGEYIKKNLFTMIAVVLMIPVILLVVADSFDSSTLPLNNFTCVLAGYQTQSTFKTLIGIGTSRIKKKAKLEEDAPTDEKQP